MVSTFAVEVQGKTTGNENVPKCMFNGRFVVKLIQTFIKIV